jgi:GTPase SAR1 family protein
MGEGGVGKTTLLRQLGMGHFDPSTPITIGLNLEVVPWRILAGNPGVPYDVIGYWWDFGGAERFRFLCTSFMRGCVGGLLCYDTTRYSTVHQLKAWLRLWRANMQPDAPLCLVGLKQDLLDPEDQNRMWRTTQSIAEELGIRLYFNCSARNPDQIRDYLTVFFENVFAYNMQIVDGLLALRSPIDPYLYKIKNNLPINQIEMESPVFLKYSRIVEEYCEQNPTPCAARVMEFLDATLQIKCQNAAYSILL